MVASYGPMNPRLAQAIKAMEAHPEFQQFGQDNDAWAWDGRTACTHTIMQSLVFIWKNEVVSLNSVNSLAGMPRYAKAPNGSPRGMRNTEVAKFFENTQLPYRVVYGLSFEQLMSYSLRGPVFYAMRYGSAPEWRGRTYQGVTASPPYAIKGGKTQLTGFENGRHAVLLLGYRARLKADGTHDYWIAYRKEPNHGSASRPEKPPYDIIRTTEAKREYLDWQSKLGLTLYAAVPTKDLPVTTSLWGSDVPPSLQAIDSARVARMLRNMGINYGTVINMVDLQSAFRKANVTYGTTIDASDLTRLLSRYGV